jgi:N-acetylmuramoyl-L-alanine amidase
MKHNATVLLVLTAFLSGGCGRSIYYVVPREWNPPSKRDSIIQIYRPSLEGRHIFLDPGHGGEDRSGRGPEGDAVEADVNLRVARALREYLLAAGAIVDLSRDRDTLIALADRPQLAVRSGAEVFISLHHNATGTGDGITNYSSVYYHARPGSAEYFLCNQDLARYIQRDMSYAMRNPGPPYSPTFDGTLSDFDIYPNSGFAVLRQNPLPSVLIEGSFFTHPHEEQRLALAEFNTIEAWGIFLGLGKYFRAGIPTLALRSDSVVRTPRGSLVAALEARVEVDRRTIDARLDGSETPWLLDDSAGTITITPSRDLKSGDHTLSLVVKNQAGNSSWPFKKTIRVMLPPANLQTILHPSVLPPERGAMARYVCSVQDSSGDPVADGTPVRVRAPKAGVDTIGLTRNGNVVVTLTAPDQEGIIPIEVFAGFESTTDSLRVRRGEIGNVSGLILGRTGNLPIGGATVSLISEQNDDAKIADRTLEDGRYIIGDTLKRSLLVEVRRDGFFPARQKLLELLSHGQNILLTTVADGVLQDRSYAIDPRFGGSETGDTAAGGLRSSDINLAIATRLERLLRAAGARVFPLRSSDTTITESERARRSAEFPRGMYLRIDAGLPILKAECEIFRNAQNQQMSEKILGSLFASAALDSSRIVASRERFFSDVAMGTVSVRLPSVATGYFNLAREQKIDRISWALFAGILHQRGFNTRNRPAYRVTDAETGAPLPGVPVTLDRTFTQVSDSAAAVTFFGLEQPDSEILVPGMSNAILSKFP